MHRRMGLAAGFLAWIVLFSACSAGGPRSSTTTKTPRASTTSIAATGTSSSEPETTSGGSVGPAVVACLSSALSASVKLGSGAGGHEAVVVVFTNASSRACTLDGYPATVWFVGAGNARLGATVTQEDSSGPIVMVTLLPGQEAATTVWADDPSVSSSTYCDPVGATAVSVELPSNSSTMTVPVLIPVCSTNNVIGTTPITAGSAQSPQ